MEQKIAILDNSIVNTPFARATTTDIKLAKG